MKGTLHFIVFGFTFFFQFSSIQSFAETMIEVPAGPFLMGAPDEDSSIPQLKIDLHRFWIDAFEVTNAEYQSVFPAHRYPSGKQRHPVSLVTWEEAKDYCKAVDKRLPSASEWEKAARGTDGRHYPWGALRNRKKPHPSYSGMVKRVVGYNKKDKSFYGVRDMAASVWEWTLDAVNGKKIARGGVWNHHLDFEYSTTYDRIEINPNQRFIFLGFRCLR